VIVPAVAVLAALAIAVIIRVAVGDDAQDAIERSAPIETSGAPAPATPVVRPAPSGQPDSVDPATEPDFETPAEATAKPTRVPPHQRGRHRMRATATTDATPF